MAEDLLSEILDQIVEGVATLTAEGVVVSWNPEAVRLTGYSLQEVNDIGLLRLFNPPDEIEKFLCTVHAEQRDLNTRLVLQRSDGQRLPVDVRCSPLRHAGRTQGRVVLILRDRSELEELQRRLLQSERLHLLGRMAGTVSHEIRNPLTAIFLHTDILDDELHQECGGDREQLLRSLGAIKIEVTRLNDLVQQYLSLARLSDLPREPVEFHAFLDAFRVEFQGRCTERGISLRYEGTAAVGRVALHRNSFRRVLINLCNNAVEAMPHGGMLRLRTWRQSGQMYLEIDDTGCGIPSEELSVLFDPFHTTKPEGTGLGLYVVREIVNAHEGDITVASEVGVGTTFTVSLPFLEPAEASEA